MNDQTNIIRIGGIDETVLNAYIDGELPERQMQQLQQELNNDEVASDYVRNSRKLNRLGRAALDSAAEQPISPELRSVLNKLKESDTRQKREVFSNHPYFAVAASLILMVVGYSMGFLSAERGFQQQILAMDRVREYARNEVRAEMNRVLEHTPSGTSVNWKSEAHNVSAELLPIRTLKTPDQRYCREFQEILLIDGVQETRHGLSCRIGKEKWETRMILPNENKAIF